ncbi:MAG TPA: YceI family protein [Candidatus Omnitrophota bacterium]|nr:YceI family protein [Candidatus Omnitrophota bacterium]HQO58004.1 YceI family protein [Candidatus Omnitrophota bacterium]HQP12553.1 YceI family protein [Candidatus Omnitrophota bacterium]
MRARTDKMTAGRQRRFFNPRPAVCAAAAALAAVLFLTRVVSAAGQEEYSVDHVQSRIEGSIKYSVIGRYQAKFEKFDGEIFFDPAKNQLTGVNLRIDNRSLCSSYKSLDRIILSPRILHVEKYPRTLFKSKSITPADKKDEYSVTGDLTLHGVTREITFPFTAEGPFPQQDRKRILARGEWVIARKDYNMYWHSFLDKAGLIVGNHMTVDWEITAVSKPVTAPLPSLP